MVKPIKVFAFVCAFLCSCISYASFDTDIEGLLAKSNKQKAQTIEKLAEYKTHPQVVPVLRALLNAKLYYKKDNKQIVIIEQQGDEFLLADAITDETLGIVGKKHISKIRINNRLRRVLNENIAILELSSPVESVRYESARNLLKVPDESLREQLAGRIKEEESRRVLTIIELTLAILNLNADNQDIRLIAVKTLSDSVESEALAALNKIVEKDDDGNYLEQNEELIAYTEKRLKAVDSKLALFKVIENTLFGLSLGSILLLAAIGLAITFGVMGVINMAHGEMIMLGAYTTFAIQQLFPALIDMSLIIAIPVAFLVTGAIGVLIERIVIRHLYGRPLDTLLATFGISLILQQAVRTYSSNSVSVISPEWISGAWQINGALALTYNRIYIFFFALAVLALLALLLKKTMIGLQMRAVTQNRAMANSMGIKSSWVDALTFGLGSGIAGIAGVALSQIDSVSPNLGQAYIIDSFMVVVFGGVGNILGTLFGAMSLGILNKFLEPFTGAVVGKILVLIFIILFIQWRPRGLFALKGRFVED